MDVCLNPVGHWLTMFARMRIDLDALAANYDLFVHASIGEAGAVIKANAYGLGADRISECLFQRGCRSFFFANFDEAADCNLPKSATKYVFAPVDDARVLARAASEGLVPIFNSTEHIRAWREVTVAKHGLSVDTGMNRLGVRFDELIKRSVDIDEAFLCLLMTHLACADQPEHEANRAQIDRFKLWPSRYPHARTSIGNSAGILTGPPYQGELTRPGIGLYGGNPFADQPNPMQTVVRCEGMVLQKQTVKAGESVGYGATHVLACDTPIALIGMGYADGLSRAMSDSGKVAFRGALMPIVGRVSMDSIQIDASACPELSVGEFVEYFGDTISIDKVAATMDTISYELLCGIGSRVVREYSTST